MKDKLVSVIIVSYNSESFIEKCVSSIIEYLPKNSEIIVIDNSSTDKTVSKLENFLPKIKLIQSDINLGFGKGNNLASKNANGEFLFFLNPDTEINEPILEKLIEFYMSNPDIGIVAPKLIMTNGHTQESVRKSPSITGAFKEFIFGMKNEYSQYVPKENFPIEVESVYGAALLIKTELFRKLKGFDEKYFMYYEDADLCKRITNLGFKIYYYPLVGITHLVGATKSQTEKYKLNYDSSIKYHGLIPFLFLQAIFRLRRLFGYVKI